MSDNFQPVPMEMELEATNKLSRQPPITLSSLNQTDALEKKEGISKTNLINYIHTKKPLTILIMLSFLPSEEKN